MISMVKPLLRIQFKVFLKLNLPFLSKSILLSIFIIWQSIKTLILTLFFTIFLLFMFSRQQYEPFKLQQQSPLHTRYSFFLLLYLFFFWNYFHSLLDIPKFLLPSQLALIYTFFESCLFLDEFTHDSIIFHNYRKVIIHIFSLSFQFFYFIIKAQQLAL